MEQRQRRKEREYSHALRTAAALTARYPVRYHEQNLMGMWDPPEAGSPYGREQILALVPKSRDSGSRQAEAAPEPQETQGPGSGDPDDSAQVKSSQSRLIALLNRQIRETNNSLRGFADSGVWAWTQGSVTGDTLESREAGQGKGQRVAGEGKPEKEQLGFTQEEAVSMAASCLFTATKHEMRHSVSAALRMRGCSCCVGSRCWRHSCRRHRHPAVRAQPGDAPELAAAHPRRTGPHDGTRRPVTEEVVH